MERFCKVAILFLLAPALALGQWQIGQRSFYHTSAAPSAQVFNAFCAQPGTNTSYTTAAIDTTGAKAIAIVVEGANASVATITDNKSNGNPTAITSYGGAPYSEIYYYLLPTVGSGHTFSFSFSSADYATVCILPMKGINGAHDATDQGTHNAATTTCQALSSINPGAGTHIVIAAFGYGNGPLTGVDSSYILQAHVDGVSAVAYGGAAASLVQNPGASTNPTWTDSASETNSCAITSFN